SSVPRNAIALVAAATVVRLLLAAVVPLFPDETYYWEWSRRIAAGYFDHPPAIAFLIRAGTTLFGATSIGVRAGVVLAGAIASWAMVVLAGRLAISESVSEPVLEPVFHAGGTDERGLLQNAASRAALLVSIIPVALVGFVLATPDAPLLASIALTLVALERAIAAPSRSRDALGWWIAAGIALGLAFCSKYTAVIVPMGVLVAFLVRSSLRARLAEPGPYIATAVALLVLAPNLLWNARHGWISFAFQLQHGLGASRGSPLTRELNLIGGQLGLISPIIAVMAAIAVARCLRRTRDDRRFLLATVATAVIVFFMLSALRKPVEANWPAPALLAALPLLAVWDVRGTARKWLIAGCALAAVSTLVVALHAATGILRLPVRRDPIARAHGWDDLALAVRRARATPPASACSTILLAADRYQDASELAYHLPGHPRVFALNLGGRRNQYDLWPALHTVAQPDDCVLFVADAGPAGDAVVQRIHASSAVPVSAAALRWDGRTVARRAIWLLRGVPSSPPASLVLSPRVRASADSVARAFAARSGATDSVVQVFRRGPSPYLVQAAESGPPVSNSDRRALIAVRVNELHQMLLRMGATAVYRDARYPECTFVRTGFIEGTEIGYVHTAEGCKLAGGNGDQRLVLNRVLTRARNDWYVYAAPAPGNIVR
ncbi:MAG: ArnT family glycosyltransferase, partial [Gemmatimonadaceae bacterium]